MTQFTNVKYMEPKREEEVVTADQSAITTPTFAKSPVFPSFKPISIAPTQATPVTSGLSQSQNITSQQTNVASSQNNINVANNKPTTQSAAQTTSQPAAQPVAKKEYILLTIYKNLFNYFSNALRTNKIVEQDIDLLNQEDLRVYADKILIRNQELTAYTNSLEKWAVKFGKRVVPTRAPNSAMANKPGMGLNKPAMGLARPQPMMNKPGMGLNKPAMGLNKPGLARPQPMMNKPAMGLNKPAMGLNKPGLARPQPMMNKPGLPKTSSTNVDVPVKSLAK